LKKKMSATTVTCTDGNSCRLDETILPIGDVPAESRGCVSFLDVPEPEHARWQPLAHFGVGVKQDVNFYLRCLEKLSCSACELQQVTYFYEQIQARCNEDQVKVRLADLFLCDIRPVKLLTCIANSSTTRECRFMSHSHAKSRSCQARVLGSPLTSVFGMGLDA
jgi:hypothetical protein